MNNELLNLLAALKAIHWYAWNVHWNATGPEFYSDHLLFERLYQTGPPNIVEQIDGLAERLVGSGVKVDAYGIDQRAAAFMAQVKGRPLVEGALALEKAFAVEAGRALPKLQGYGPKAVTLDNYVRTLVDERSTAVYLLQQRLAGGAYGALDEPAAIGAAVFLPLVLWTAGGALAGQGLPQLNCWQGAALGLAVGVAHAFVVKGREDENQVPQLALLEE